MRQVRLLIVLAFLATSLYSAQAQGEGGGQFCLRAFEDRNANGTLDGGEPFLTRDVSANLLNAENVVIASALLDSSPTAAQGVICFQFLPDGQYTMEITSVGFTPTTPSSITASITAGTLPTVVEYGAQRITDAPAAGSATAQDEALDQDTLQRLVLSGLGALVVLAGMTVLGVLIYLAVFRPRRPARPYYVEPRRTPTGGVPPVILDDDDIPPMPERTPTPGSVPLVDLLDEEPPASDDTSEIRPV